MTRNWTIAAVLVVNLIFGITAFKAQAVPESTASGIACVLEIVVETRLSEGEASTKRIQREFVLQHGKSISEDLSDLESSEYLDAAIVKDNDDKTVSLKWFADTGDIGSVELETSVLLEEGDKSGRSVGSNTIHKSNQRIRTNFTLTCTEL
jgi:hypothetical protein